MAAPSLIYSPSGVRHARFFAVDTTTGHIEGDTSTLSGNKYFYTGLKVEGVKAPMTVSEPEPRQAIFPGNDTVQAVHLLPPNTTIMSGELRSSTIDHDLIAAMTGTKNHVVGEANFMGVNTDRKGREVPMWLLTYAQATDEDPDDNEVPQWAFRLYYSWIVPRQTEMADLNHEQVYSIVPKFIKKYPWDVAFSTASNGYTRSQGLYGNTYNPPNIAYATGDNTTTEWFFPASEQAANVTSMAVFINGSPTPPTGYVVTKATDKVTITGSLQAGLLTTDYVHVWYELA